MWYVIVLYQSVDLNPLSAFLSRSASRLRVVLLAQEAIMASWIILGRCNCTIITSWIMVLVATPVVDDVVAAWTPELDEVAL